ncbi:hypothetical protein TWF694_001203 [Orbilia ellipsospora]|uniref:alpha-glucosidase n=1 Tax=Orbilia ellipsospora TaxID=2528407 RepID=A0AAV9XSF1_9PEZI
MAQIAKSLQEAIDDIIKPISNAVLPEKPTVLPEESTPHGSYKYETLPAWVGPTSLEGSLIGKTGHTTKYGPSIDRLKFEVGSVTPDIVRVKITDASQPRWEIPEQWVPIGRNILEKHRNSHKMDWDLAYDANNVDIGFAIIRSSDGFPLFDSRGCQISYCEHYMEITTQLPKDTYVFGMGEVTGPFLREQGRRYAFWARDAQTPLHENAYSSFPMFIGMNGGKAFGVHLHNSNALDMIYDDDKITYKVVGGVLDFFIFTGEYYEDVVRQYQLVTGFPSLPPYWAFGYHQCRWYYDTLSKFDEARKKNIEADIPVDVFWLDIDYMEQYKLFTLDPKRYPSFAQYVEKDMKKDNHKLVAILDPGIKCNVPDYKPWTRGCEMDIFIKNKKTGDNFIGKVWPGHVVFPDWVNPNILPYWKEMLEEWFKIMPVDGIWHDMNECSNFVNGDVRDGDEEAQKDEILIPTDEETVEEMAKAAAEGIELEDDGKRGAAKPKPLIAFDPEQKHSITNPPYSVNHGGDDWNLSARGISVDAYHYKGTTEFDLHNLFGHLNCAATYDSMLQIRPGTRPFILTRSAFAGTGRLASKWLGDNFSNWESMRYSIAGMLNMQIFGIPHIGADIGGFNGAPSEELLIRWFQLGSMYPFCRNHNMPNTPPQEAYVSKKVADVARTYLTLRYRLLPFWYTTFATICRIAGSVVQPVWAQYTPQKRGKEMEKVMKNANDCFLIGKDLLVVPVVTPGAKSVTTWIPSGVWYDLLSGSAIASHEDQWVELDAPLTKMPMLVHGGSIIPMHFNKSGKTTVDFRAGGFSLLVALDAYGHAKGNLYLDDGTHYDSKQSWIHITAELTNNTGRLVIETTSDEIFGYKPKHDDEYIIHEVVLMSVGVEPISLATNITLCGRLKYFVEV